MNGYAPTWAEMEFSVLLRSDEEKQSERIVDAVLQGAVLIANSRSSGNG